MSVQTGVPDKWTSDSKRFILENFDTICNYPSQMYDSALTLCPSSSWVHKCYAAKFPPKVKVVVGLAEWGACTRTVFCNHKPCALAYWKNTIAAGYSDNDIGIFDALTGSQVTVLCGHNGYVYSLAFSSDGTLLVSGGHDNTIKLWDVQTGGVVKTLHGHTDLVHSVSISADNTMIASGSRDETICLWNIRTGECCISIIKGQNEWVTTVSFSPTNSQLLLSVSHDGTVKKWDTDGHQIGSPIPGSHAAFSPDGTQFLTCEGSTVTIWNTDSGASVAEFHLTHAEPEYCYFSPDGRFIACADDHAIYLWDITGPDSHLIKTLIGHTEKITSHVFSSSLTLISASWDDTIKFWEISASSTSPVTPLADSISLTSAPIVAVSLQAKDGLAFSVDSVGVVRTWDILTGLCKESFETQAKNIRVGDIQLIDGRLTIVGHIERQHWDQEIQVWDVEKDKHQTMRFSGVIPVGVRISGDGSRVFHVDDDEILAWSVKTGKVIGSALLEPDFPYLLDPLWIDGSKVLVRCGGSSTLAWNFGTSGSTPIQISPSSSDRPCLDFIGHTSYSNTCLVGIEDRVTGKVVFQLPGKTPSAVQWDGHYLIAGYGSGEVLILDLSNMLP